ncbi:hypothetical protein Rsub_06917 [Raphidocelis subcapitata]|uniref:Haloacid dehalogenase n=1 Tax=Raphidocelis subcapitata TaxID=307507 RepID=A0A2V0PB22_9CHLO|nr:hypothetical protein Rsub_06917 [Raphidocelis subcapitata]|eukprot:GBF94295.1 hypothetical protein Rsub_06917 [Raphidocelis subcapitata]
MGSEGGRLVTLVTFDVDGTLIRSCGADANKLHKEAFVAGFRKVFNVDTNIDVIAHHGGTDPLIALKCLEHSGVPKEESMPKLKEFEAAMVEHFEAHRARAGLGLQLLPGVARLLSTLKARPDVETCLVTGNLEPIGWGKMAALGIDGLFSSPRFGGFGSDYCSGSTEEMWRDRAEFINIAARRAREALGGDIAIGRRWHVGDTPADVRAAVEAGAAALGVATGTCSAEQLEAARRGPDDEIRVLASLEDTEAVLAALGLE